MDLKTLDRALSSALAPLRFSAPVTHVYNPLDYARPSHEAFLDRFGARLPREVVLLGMNPGPWGMAQTGVPFGEAGIVSGWLGIDAPIGRPEEEHPKRPVLGLGCPRSEVSGARLWGMARRRFGTPDAFFARFFILNYCPLSFMEASGRNRTPDKLPAAEREPLFAACDDALRQKIALLRPRFLVGIGAFAEGCIRRVLGPAPEGIVIGRMLHPSPASPAANKGWEEAAVADLRALGIEIPEPLTES